MVEVSSLTEKEREVLRLVGQNYTSKEIARELDISVRAVDHRVENARKKLGNVTRVEAARMLGNDGISSTGMPFTVPPGRSDSPSGRGRDEDDISTFRDSGAWQHDTVFVRGSDFLDPAPGLRPEQISIGHRLAIIANLSLRIALLVLVMLGVVAGLEGTLFD